MIEDFFEYGDRIRDVVKNSSERNEGVKYNERNGTQIMRSISFAAVHGFSQQFEVQKRPSAGVKKD